MSAIDCADKKVQIKTSTAAIAGGLVRGRIYHRRSRPRVNEFTYHAFYFCLNLEDIDRVKRPFVSVDRFNLLSFHRADFGPRDGSDLRAWIDGILAANGFSDIADGDILLQGHPRVLGYVFNPVSFWFCHDKSGALRAVLAEVSNTFGERHLYLVAHEDKRPIGPQEWLASDKVFHVSPFLPVAGRYRFRFRLEDGRMRADIHYHDADGPMLVTYIDGARHDLSSAAVLRALLRHPAMTLAVVGLIHYQALKLWWKRARFHRKPEPPQQPLTR
jgi:DUF1365 family protein